MTEAERKQSEPALPVSEPPLVEFPEIELPSEDLAQNGLSGRVEVTEVAAPLAPAEDIDPAAAAAEPDLAPPVASLPEKEFVDADSNQPAEAEPILDEDALLMEFAESYGYPDADLDDLRCIRPLLQERDTENGTRLRLQEATAKISFDQKSGRLVSITFYKDELPKGLRLPKNLLVFEVPNISHWPAGLVLPETLFTLKISRLKHWPEGLKAPEQLAMLVVKDVSYNLKHDPLFDIPGLLNPPNDKFGLPKAKPAASVVVVPKDGLGAVVPEAEAGLVMSKEAKSLRDRIRDALAQLKVPRFNNILSPADRRAAESSPQSNQGGGIEYGVSLIELKVSQLKAGDVVKVWFGSNGRARKNPDYIFTVLPSPTGSEVPNDAVPVSCERVGEKLSLPDLSVGKELVVEVDGEQKWLEGVIYSDRKVTRIQVNTGDNSTKPSSGPRNEVGRIFRQADQEGVDGVSGQQELPAQLVEAKAADDLAPVKFPPVLEVAPPADSGVREVAEESARAERAPYPYYDQLVNAVDLSKISAGDVIHIMSTSKYDSSVAFEAFRVVSREGVDAANYRPAILVVERILSPIDKILSSLRRDKKAEWRFGDDELKVGQEIVPSVAGVIDRLMVAKEDKRQEFKKMTYASQIEHDVLLSEIDTRHLRPGDYVHVLTKSRSRYVIKVTEVTEDGVNVILISGPSMAVGKTGKLSNGIVDGDQVRTGDSTLVVNTSGMAIDGGDGDRDKFATSVLQKMLVCRNSDTSVFNQLFVDAADGAAAAAPTPEPAAEPVSAVAPAPEAAQPADVPETTSPSAEVKGFEYTDWEEKQDVVRKLRTLKVGDKLTWKLVGSKETNEKEVTVLQFKMDKGFGELEDFDPDKHNLEDAIAFFDKDQRPLAISRLLYFAARGIITEVTTAGDRDLTGVSGIVPISWPEESEKKSSSPTDGDYPWQRGLSRSKEETPPRTEAEMVMAEVSAAEVDDDSEEQADRTPISTRIKGLVDSAKQWLQRSREAAASQEDIISARPVEVIVPPVATPYIDQAQKYFSSDPEAGDESETIATNPARAVEELFTYLEGIHTDPRELSADEVKYHLYQIPRMIQRIVATKDCLVGLVTFRTWVDQKKVSLPPETPEGFADLQAFIENSYSAGNLMDNFNIEELKGLLQYYMISLNENKRSLITTTDPVRQRQELAQKMELHRKKIALIALAIISKE
ncbi:MAG TPA: hypothetical protein PKX78_03100 [Candidatus Woesebacteria bacterium]|nr:hypothetical protein [Candidatus Woesebacteria bacterium]